MTVKVRMSLFVSVALACSVLAMALLPQSALGGSLDDIVYSEGRGSLIHCGVEYDVDFFETHIAPFIDADHECAVVQDVIFVGEVEPETAAQGLAPLGTTPAGLIRQPETDPATYSTSSRATRSLSGCKSYGPDGGSSVPVKVGDPVTETLVLVNNGGTLTTTYQKYSRHYYAPSLQSVWRNGDLVLACTYNRVSEEFVARVSVVLTPP